MNGKREMDRRLRQMKAVKIGIKRAKVGAKLRPANGVEKKV